MQGHHRERISRARSRSVARLDKPSSVCPLLCTFRTYETGVVEQKGSLSTRVLSGYRGNGVRRVMFVGFDEGTEKDFRASAPSSWALSERHQPSPVALAEVPTRARTRVAPSRVSRSPRTVASVKARGARRAGLAASQKVNAPMRVNVLKEKTCSGRGAVRGTGCGQRVEQCAGQAGRH